MQEYAISMRRDLWTNLRKVFDNVSQGRDQIGTVQIQHVVKNIMGETEQNELDYIFKNMFRVDIDNSGSVDFNQFANFFLKRHCGQISLQRAHKRSLIKSGVQRKINLQEFLGLLTNAYSFLNVETDQKFASQIFRIFDVDRDNLITYVEYFGFIDKYICKSKEVLKAEATHRPLPAPEIYVPAPVVVPQGRMYRSRLRLFIWESMRVLYNNFDFNKDGKLQLEEIKTLITDILKLKTRKDIDYILFNLFDLGNSGEIGFEMFCPYFVEHVAELGLSALVSMNSGMKRVLNFQQFSRLFTTSFVFLSASRVQSELLRGFFNAIDTNRDGLILFQQYITWVKDFLSPLAYRGDAYYFVLDDMDQSIGSNMILDQLRPVVVKESALVRQSIVVSRVSFRNKDLAKRIRANIFQLISEFDRNRNKQFQESEIIEILQVLLNENDYQIPYVIRNVFRYDKDNDTRVTFSEMANFLLEMHCGEMSIQRLHMKQLYKLGNRRVMDAGQFVLTLNDALQYIRASASERELRELFEDIDLDRDGLITYKEYFEFLRLYFGSGSLAALQDVVVKSETLSIIQEFGLWLRIESSKILKPFLTSKMRMDIDALRQILRRVFRESESEIDYVIKNLFNLIFDPNNYMSDDEVRKLLLLLHVGLVLLLRGHLAKKFAKWSQLMLNKQEFIQLVLEATEWAELPTNVNILGRIFIELDTNRDGFITYFQYLEFLCQCIGCSQNFQLDNFFRNMFPVQIQQEIPTIAVTVPRQVQEQQAGDFYYRIFNELRQLYNFYLKGGVNYLGKDDIKLLIGQVLKENNQQQLDYVFWNYSRLDKDGDNQVTFQQFAPFILNHATEIALQRFHSTQQKGKNALTVQEFVIVASMAFGFLRSIPKEEPILRTVYDLLDTDRSGNLSYKEYMMWAKSLVKHYK